MNAIWLGVNKKLTLTITTTDNANVPYDPTPVLPTVTVWQDNGDGTYTEVLTPATMTKFQNNVGVYTYCWDISGATPGNYILIYNFIFNANTLTQTDTLQLVNLDWMGSGGAVLAAMKLKDSNTGNPLEGVVIWLQLSSTLGDIQTVNKLTDSFGVVNFWTQPGTYYVFSEAYATYIGTLLVTAGTPAVFTPNPAL